MKRMKTWFILWAAVAFAGAPIAVHGQQISPNPNTSQGEIVVTTAQDNSEDFDNYGDIELNAAFGAGGMLTNNAGATLTIYGSPYHATLDINAPSVVIVVSPPSSYTLPGGSLFNNGTVYNSGTVGNADVLYNSGSFTNYTGGILYNGFSLVSGPAAARLTNNGTMTNNGELENDSTGDLENNGTLTNAGNGHILNSVGGILNNNSGGILNNNLGSSLVNNGAVGNSGTLTNNVGASLTNSGSFISTGSFTNSGTFYNYGGAVTGAFQSSGITDVFGGTALAPNTFAGTVTNDSGGQFNVGYGGTAGYVTFQKAVTNSAGATFTITKSYATFEGAVTNNGTWVSDPSTIIFNALFTGGGTVSPSAEDTYEFLGAGANTINLGGRPIDIATLILGQGATLNITDGSLTVNELIDPTGTDSGITGAFTAKSYGTLQTPDIRLVPGWNLISLPAQQPADAAISSVLSGIKGAYEIVWAYPDQTWQVYDPNDAAGSTLTTMQAGIGYWIKMTSAKTLSVSGSTPPSSISLNSGWNLIGYNGASCVASSTALSSASFASPRDFQFFAWGYPGQVWEFYDPANSGSSTLKQLCPKYGYWINVNQAATWSGW